MFLSHSKPTTQRPSNWAQSYCFDNTIEMVIGDFVTEKIPRI